MKVEKLEYTNPSNWLEKMTTECLTYPVSEIPSEDSFIVVDAGANVGGFVKAWIKKFPKIYCIEASKANYQRLLENTCIYGSRVICINKAIGKNSGEILKLMHYTDEKDQLTNTGNFGVVNFVNDSNNHGWKERTGYEEVESISLEDIIQIVGGKIDLLKIDTEGSEYDFLFDKDLNCINYIVMELHNFLRIDGKQENLINHILKTHDEIYTGGDGVYSHFIKMWKKR